MIILNFDTLRLKIEDLITSCCESWWGEVDIGFYDEDVEHEITETMMQMIADEMNLKL